MENLNAASVSYPVLKISAYPFPPDLIRDIAGRCKELLILEEGYPFIEEALRASLIMVSGSMEEWMARYQ